jgi:hypothetical protein
VCRRRRPGRPLRVKVSVDGDLIRLRMRPRWLAAHELSDQPPGFVPLTEIGAKVLDAGGDGGAGFHRRTEPSVVHVIPMLRGLVARIRSISGSGGRLRVLQRPTKWCTRKTAKRDLQRL